MRILHVIDSLGLGGAEKLLVATINAMKEHEHQVVYLSDPDTLKPGLPASCKVYKLGFRSRLDIFRCVSRLRKYIRGNSIDIVHSHLVLSTLITRLATPGNIPVFSTLHSSVGSRFFDKGKLLQRAVEKFTYQKRHFIIAVSQEVMNDYQRVIGIKGQAAVLPNFVDDEFFKSDYKKREQKNVFRMLTVGSLKPPKNYQFLLNAFSYLPPDVTLDVYGDGPLRKDIEFMIDKQNLNIRLRGVSNRIIDVYHEYDLFVMASLVEGHPIALLEAMAAGMPVMVSDIPAFREATGNKAIYFSLDSTDDFVKKVGHIMNNEINLDELAKYNQELARKIAGKKMFLEQLNRIYRSAALKTE